MQSRVLLACVLSASARRTILREGDESLNVLEVKTLVPAVGQEIECNGVQVMLGDTLGSGMWGAVFKTTDGKYAVKFQMSKNRNAFSQYRTFDHECKVMTALQGHADLRVPECAAYCVKDEYGPGTEVIVQTLVQNAVSMQGLAAKKWQTPLDLKKVGYQLYKAAVALIDLKVTNADQTNVNILVDGNSDVWFIDMGMAWTASDISQICDADSSYIQGSQCKKWTYRSDASAMFDRKGYTYKCEQKDSRAKSCSAKTIALYDLTLTTALGTLPTFLSCDAGKRANCVNALSGLVGAFCEDTAHFNELRIHPKTGEWWDWERDEDVEGVYFIWDYVKRQAFYDRSWAKNNAQEGALMQAVFKKAQDCFMR